MIKNNLHVVNGALTNEEHEARKLSHKNIDLSMWFEEEPIGIYLAIANAKFATTAELLVWLGMDDDEKDGHDYDTLVKAIAYTQKQICALAKNETVDLIKMAKLAKDTEEFIKACICEPPEEEVQRKQAKLDEMDELYGEGRD